MMANRVPVAPEPRPRPVSPIQAIDRASALLEIVAAAGPSGAALTPIAAEIGLPASTTRTLLSSLIINGLLGQDSPSRRYVLGSRLIELGRVYGAQTDVASVAAPYLRELWEASRETVHLAVLQGGRRIDLAVLVSPQLLNVNPTVAPRIEESADDSAARRSLFTTAAGKVLVAAEGDTEIRASLDLSGSTTSASGQLRVRGILAELENVRNAGYAENVEEEEPGVCGLAVPIYDGTGRVCAALCVGYPSVRRSDEYRRFLLAATRASALTISRLLGAPDSLTRDADE